ncbi:MAG: hypothetical protein AAF465_13480 [Pseudomonadota bacterium]
MILFVFAMLVMFIVMGTKAIIGPMKKTAMIGMDVIFVASLLALFGATSWAVPLYIGAFLIAVFMELNHFQHVFRKRWIETAK